MNSSYLTAFAGVLLCVSLTASWSCETPDETNSEPSATSDEPVEASRPGIVRRAPAGTRLLAWSDMERLGDNADAVWNRVEASRCEGFERDDVEALAVAWGGSEVWRVEVTGDVGASQVACLLDTDLDGDSRATTGAAEGLGVVEMDEGGVAVLGPEASGERGDVSRRLREDFADIVEGGASGIALEWAAPGGDAWVSIARGDEEFRVQTRFEDEADFSRHAQNLKAFVDGAPDGAEPSVDLREDAREAEVTLDPDHRGWFVREGMVTMYRQETKSMRPTLQLGERMVAVRPPLMLEDVAAGDLAVFEFPQKSAKTYLQKQPERRRDCVDSTTLNRSNPATMVKRVVATGGQTVKFRDRQLVVDGEPVEQTVVNEEETGSYLQPTEVTVREQLGDTSYRLVYRGTFEDRDPIEVPDDHVFVLGDNRTMSSDSRCWGPVPEDNIVGRAAFIGWSEDDEGPNWTRIGTEL